MADRPTRREHDSCSSTAGNSWNSGWSGCRRSSVSRESDRPHRRRARSRRRADSMSRSSRAWSARAWSTIASLSYGHLIVDECHHLSAQSFENGRPPAQARFVLGLSATVTRKDGHHPDHLHAVWPDPASCQTHGCRRPPALRAHVVTSIQRRSCLPLRPDSGPSCWSSRRCTKGLVEDDDRNRAHLRRRGRRPCGHWPVAARADRTERAPRAAGVATRRRTSPT